MPLQREPKGLSFHRVTWNVVQHRPYRDKAHVFPPLLTVCYSGRKSKLKILPALLLAGDEWGCVSPWCHTVTPAEEHGYGHFPPAGAWLAAASASSGLRTPSARGVASIARRRLVPSRHTHPPPAWATLDSRTHKRLDGGSGPGRWAITGTNASFTAGSSRRRHHRLLFRGCNAETDGSEEQARRTGGR